jgi:hypothetical protein
MASISLTVSSLSFMLTKFSSMSMISCWYLRELRRVTGLGGFVAVRDADFAAMAWYPENKGLSGWSAFHQLCTRSNGGEANAGRQLHACARLIGLDQACNTAIAGTWCFHVDEERSSWSGL